MRVINQQRHDVTLLYKLQDQTTFVRNKILRRFGHVCHVKILFDLSLLV